MAAGEGGGRGNGERARERRSSGRRRASWERSEAAATHTYVGRRRATTEAAEAACEGGERGRRRWRRAREASRAAASRGSLTASRGSRLRIAARGPLYIRATRNGRAFFSIAPKTQTPPPPAEDDERRRATLPRRPPSSLAALASTSAPLAQVSLSAGALSPRGRRMPRAHIAAARTVIPRRRAPAFCVCLSRRRRTPYSSPPGPRGAVCPAGPLARAANREREIEEGAR
nr:uncharacterized protein LOC127322139 [Lolium perenne]